MKGKDSTSIDPNSIKEKMCLRTFYGVEVSGKRKCLDTSNKKVIMPKEPWVEKMCIIKEKSESEEIPQVVNDNVPKSNKDPIVLKQQIKIPSFFSKA